MSPALLGGVLVLAGFVLGVVVAVIVRKAVEADPRPPGARGAAPALTWRVPDARSRQARSAGVTRRRQLGARCAS